MNLYIVNSISSSSNPSFDRRRISLRISSKIKRPRKGDIRHHNIYDGKNYQSIKKNMIPIIIDEESFCPHNWWPPLFDRRLYTIRFSDTIIKRIIENIKDGYICSKYEPTLKRSLISKFRIGKRRYIIFESTSKNAFICSLKIEHFHQPRYGGKTNGEYKRSNHQFENIIFGTL